MTCESQNISIDSWWLLIQVLNPTPLCLQLGNSFCHFRCFVQCFGGTAVFLCAHQGYSAGALAAASRVDQLDLMLMRERDEELRPYCRGGRPLRTDYRLWSWMTSWRRREGRRSAATFGCVGSHTSPDDSINRVYRTTKGKRLLWPLSSRSPRWCLICSQ